MLIESLTILGILILSLCSTLLFVFFIGTFLYMKYGFFRNLYHDILDWHRPINRQWSDLVNTYSTCKYCGKDIMLDSQGNWFTYN